MVRATADAVPARGGDPPSRNEVLLLGRLAAAPTPRVLPSGDVLVQFRLVVPRASATGHASGGAGSRGRAPSVDTLDCVAWRADVRRRLSSWQPGDILEVQGALRRRFWRSGGGPTSRTEVEVGKARRVSRA